MRSRNFFSSTVIARSSSEVMIIESLPLVLVLSSRRRGEDGDGDGDEGGEKVVVVCVVGIVETDCAIRTRRECVG